MIIIYKYKMSIYNDEDELVGERIARFEPNQLVYIVKQRHKKIIIIRKIVLYLHLKQVKII